MAIERDPLTYDRDGGDSQETEFSFGRGMAPRADLDYSEDGVKSGIPVADPDRVAQRRELLAIRRMDINDPGAQPDPFVCGNTDRYGAQPPVVRERRSPRNEPRPRYARPRMERQW